MKKILLVCGSCRRLSLNRQLMARAAEALRGDFAVSELNYRDLPLLNQDEEYPAPAEVARVRREVMAADALIIFSPEYNHEIPGGLKNLLDWLSRPLEKDNYEKGSAIKHRKVALASVAGNSGGGFVRKHLKEMLAMVGMQVLGGEGFGARSEQRDRDTDTLRLKEDEEAAFAAFLDAVRQSV